MGTEEMFRRISHVGWFIPVIMMTGCVWLRDLPYREQRLAADQAFENQQYVLAAARYEALQDRYPDNRIRQDILFRQGVAFYSISSYHDARFVFSGYLKAYPHGQYVADAEDYLRKIDVLMSKATPAVAKKLDAARSKEDLNELGKLLVDHPTDWRVLESIGDVHWKLGNYDLAIDYYYRAHSIASTYEERNLSNGKLILDDAGKPIPVTPKSLEAMEVERHPLRVYNVHTYRSRNLSAEQGSDIQFYNLTGSVRNQGRELLQDVEVEVIYRDVGNSVLDVDYVRIGSLGPGEVRTFLSRADSYDNLYNIVDHDVEVHWRD